MRKKKTIPIEEIEEAMEEDKLYESDSDSADELDEAEAPIIAGSNPGGSIKEITVYPVEIVCLFQDGASIAYRKVE